MKKNIILVLSLVLALSLAGCGGTTAEEPKTETKQEAVVEDVAPAPTEVTPEVVEEEPEATEEVVAEEPEVEDPFAKYDNGDFLGEDIYAALDEFEGQPVAILVAPGRIKALASWYAYNYNAIISGIEKWDDIGVDYYAVSFNDNVEDKVDPDGDPFDILKESSDSYYVGSLSETEAPYLNKDALSGTTGSDMAEANILKVNDDEKFKTELVKDTSGNTIGILFISQETLSYLE